MIRLLLPPIIRISVLLGLLTTGFVLLPANISHAAGPKLSGPMQVFQLAPSTRPRPSATWQDAAGKNLTLADFSGKVVMVNYWASWCPPCIRELPSIDRLQASLGGDNFTVVAINIDRGGKPIARRMAKRLKIKHLALYLDRESKSARSLGVRSMPTTFIFDRKGREVGKLEGGAEWDEKEAVALVKYFINNPGYADKLPKK
mgnify:CR=1 FL=1